MSTKTCIVLVLLITPWLVATDNKPLDSKMHKAELELAVAFCVVKVRSEIEKSSRFDAFVDHDGIVRTFGTQEEGFKFDKCMLQRGHPLGPESTPDKKSR